MAILHSASRLVATLASTVQTRAALVAVEVEEEALRYFSYLIFALGAMFLGFIALLLVILLVVAVYWDTHRIGVLLTLIVLFGGGAAALAWTVVSRFKRKPHLLSHTIAELSKDIEMLKSNVPHASH
ncbi:MAG: hypothetical protein K0S28_212 [Paucimonas sp.]|jgi:uncharacterized membrane protein YqjE|nr:hypothetical protein [Paucimonas sp.]